jgi:protein SCO1/2
MMTLKISLKTLCAVCLLTMFSCKQQKKSLPIFNPSDFNPELVDKAMQSNNKYHTVLDFNLINQNGDTITQKAYEGKIYVTDFFFTNCLTICPIMTNNMNKIQNTFLNVNDVMLLSISVTPEIDSISVLREYANRKEVIDTKWHITTGKKKHIYELARKSYFAVVEQGDGGLQDFIHTPNFILIDKDKQIRGIYDGTNDADVQRVIEDIQILLE